MRFWIVSVLFAFICVGCGGSDEQESVLTSGEEAGGELEEGVSAPLDSWAVADLLDILAVPSQAEAEPSPVSAQPVIAFGQP